MQEKAQAGAKAPTEKAINDSDMDFHNGELAGQAFEKSRVKEIFNKRFQDLAAALANEVNIANRYELKIHMEEVRALFDLVSKE